MLEAVGSTFFPYKTGYPSDLSDCEVRRGPNRSRIEIVEPLLTAAPASASPLCCYRKTVIFYEHPSRLLPDRSGFAEHDRRDCRLELHDVVRVGAELFEMRSGAVRWYGTRWVMIHGALRCAETDIRKGAA